MSDVTVIKMMNGEEIITKVVKEDESTFTCEKPAIIMLSPNQKGNGVQVQNWSIFCIHRQTYLTK